MNTKLSAIYIAFIKLEIRELIKYHDAIENQLNNESQVIDSKFENLKNINDEDFLDILTDSKIEEFQNFTFNYPNSFRKSIIIQTYSFLEYYLKRICELKYSIDPINDKLDDLNVSSDLNRVQIYLEEGYNVDISKLQPEWSFIQKVRSVRNCIVHHGGEFEINKYSLARFVRNHKSLNVKDYEEEFNNRINRIYELIIVDKQLNIEFITQIEKFLSKIVKEIFKY